jgi:hypothetical protein
MQGLTSTGFVPAHHALNNTQRDDPLPTLSVSSHTGQVGLPCVTCARLGHIRIPRAMPDHGHVRHAMSCHCQAKPYRLGCCRVLRTRSCPNLVALPEPARNLLALAMSRLCQVARGRPGRGRCALPGPCHDLVTWAGAAHKHLTCTSAGPDWSHGPGQATSRLGQWSRGPGHVTQARSQRCHVGLVSRVIGMVKMFLTIKRNQKEPPTFPCCDRTRFVADCTHTSTNKDRLARSACVTARVQHTPPSDRSAPAPNPAMMSPKSPKTGFRDRMPAMRCPLEALAISGYKATNYIILLHTARSQ